MPQISKSSDTCNPCDVQKEALLVHCGVLAVMVKSMMEECDLECHQDNVDVESIVKLIGARLLLRKLSLTHPSEPFDKIEEHILDQLQKSPEDLTSKLLSSGFWPRAVDIYMTMLQTDDINRVGSKLFQELDDSPLNSCDKMMKRILGRRENSEEWQEKDD
jgi:hypothetical protein